MKKFKISQNITDRKDASLTLYFKDVSKLSLITPEKEIELAERIQKGDKKAENELIEANLRFVISVAKSYQGKGLDLVDLIQEGNLGMLEAARKYNPNKNIRFISYAVWWIRQSIIKALADQCRIVRVPISQTANMRKISKVFERYEQENERAPSVEEIEEETQLDSNKINMSLLSTCRAVSLNTPIKEEDAGCLIDVLPNTDVEDTDVQASKSDLVNEVDRILNKLTNRESDIVRMTYGIGVKQMTIDEIANRFGIGIERVRQIQHSSIEHIRKRFKNVLLELI